MKVVNLITDYEVGAKLVKLSVVIGEAQIGSSVVKLGAKKLGEGDIAGLPVGSGDDIKGRPLFVKSVVTDVNDNTNRTSITYKLDGGKRNQQFVSSGSVEEDGDSIIYRAKFNLV